MRSSFPGFPKETAHDLSSAFLAFKFGLYAKAIRECTEAIARIPGGAANDTLKKALEVIRANAQDRESSQVNTTIRAGFQEADLKYLAVNLSLEQAEDPGSLNLDNALVLVYVVALITSADDEETLGEHRRLIVRMLADYKKALGLE
jgi:hypothetical protein